LPPHIFGSPFGCTFQSLFPSCRFTSSDIGRLFASWSNPHSEHGFSEFAELPPITAKNILLCLMTLRFSSGVTFGRENLPARLRVLYNFFLSTLDFSARRFSGILVLVNCSQ